VAGPVELTSETKYRLLLEIAQKISGTLDLEEVLNHLIETVRSVVPYDAAGIFVLNRSALPLRSGDPTNLIAGMATKGFERKPAGRDLMLKAGKGIVGHVINTGESVVAADVRLDPRYIAGRAQTRSEIAVPITINRQVIGALNIESDRPGAFTNADVELLQFFANAAAISIERAMLHQQLLEKKRIESQLEIARKVQASLLPKRPPNLPGYDVAGINLPTWQVGGDYYDYIEFPNSHCGMAIADVSGKGVPAALIMATFRAALRTQVRNDFELYHIMEAVNGLLAESLGSSEFVTAVYGILDPEAGRFIYTNCGHNPPLLLRSSGGSDLLDRGGMVLGVFPESRYEADTVTLDPGDALILYTDGVIEVTDRRDVEFGLERLEATLRTHWSLPAHAMIESVVNATQAYSKADGYSDDFTLLIVKRMGT
jgi:serine phosphatase RsbU (regulator of sigma subunit)